MSVNKPTIAEVADAVVAELNDPARNWSQAFTAERLWLPRPTSSKLKQMQVVVMTGATTQKLHNRLFRERGHEIQIVFRKAVNPDNTAAIDALAAFVETVADYYGADNQNYGAKKVAGTEAIVMGVTVETLVSPEELDENRRFFSVLTLAVTEIADVTSGATEEPGDDDGDGAAGIDIQEITSTSPPFGGNGEVTTEFALLTPVNAGLLVFVLQVFQKSGNADITVSYGSDSGGVGNLPMTLDANVDLPGDPSYGKLKIYSVPVGAGSGYVVVDLGGDTAYLTGDPFNITGLPVGVKNAVNIQNGLGGEEPEIPTTSTTTNEAVIAGFMMRTTDKNWEWRNDYTGCHDYNVDFYEPDYISYRATAGYRFAGAPGTFNAALDLVTPSEWGGIAVTYR